MAIVKHHGSWMARVYYKDELGKRHSTSKGGFKTKREAELYLSQMKLDLHSGELIKDESPLFSDYFNKWYETYKEKTITDVTKLHYVHTYNVIKKYFTNDKLEDLNREKYQKFLDEYGSNHAKETISKINSLIHACIKDAIYDGDIKKDFIQRTNLVFNKSKTWKIEYLNIEELKKLTNYLIATKNKHYTSKYMILLAIYTGMRLGEIQALKWKNIDFENCMINVVQSYNAKTKEYIPVKTESSKRSIRVNKKVLSIIKELNENGTDTVFVSQFGTIPTSNAVNKVLRDCFKELNINKPSFHFHSLRHTHVAYLLYNHVDLYIISKRLGHSDIGITSKKYAYLIDEYKNRSNDEIAQILNKL